MLVWIEKQNLILDLKKGVIIKNKKKEGPILTIIRTIYIEKPPDIY